eukprot:s7498_g1.t1
MLCDCSCFDGGSIRALGQRAMPGEMTEVDYTPDILTEVPDVPPPTTEAPVVPSESRVEEPETPVLKSKVKAMPKRRKATAKVALKRMPRPTVKKVKVKQEASESSRNIQGTTISEQ